MMSTPDHMIEPDIVTLQEQNTSMQEDDWMKNKCVVQDKDTKEGKEMLKRVKDSLKKKMLRKDEDYRQKEADKAKARMAKKRTNNSEYREQEKQRDRERKAMARKNTEKRKVERERDKDYRRKRRAGDSKKANDNLIFTDCNQT